MTAHPTAEWIAQQITEAFPWNDAPRYLIGDRDGIYTVLLSRADYEQWVFATSPLRPARRGRTALRNG